MRKNRWLWLGAGLLLTIGAALVVLSLLPAGQGISRANFDCIQIGTTRAEVETLFGAKADGLVWWGRGVYREAAYWRDPNTRAEATIVFDADDCVVASMWWPGNERSILDRVLDRLLMRDPPEPVGVGMGIPTVR